MKSQLNQLEEDITIISKPKGLLAKLFKLRFTKHIASGQNPINQNKEEILHLKEEMWHLLGIDYWSDILYFHFDND